jgi:hypothetical protein
MFRNLHHKVSLGTTGDRYAGRIGLVWAGLISLHDDRDFDPMASHLSLKTATPPPF